MVLYYMYDLSKVTENFMFLMFSFSVALQIKNI